MSDEPSDAQKLIADVLRRHAVERCTCEICVDTWSKGAAAEVDKAPGGLKREIRGRRGVTTHVRFVSGWTVTE